MSIQGKCNYFKDFLSNENIDENFKNMILGLIYTANNNPEKAELIGQIIKKAFINQEANLINNYEDGNETTLKDWSSFVYGNFCVNSYFGSYSSKEYMKYGYIYYNYNLHHIYKSTDGNIHLKYRPNWMFKSIVKDKRINGSFHHIELVVKPSEIKLLDLDEDTELYLANGKSVMDEIVTQNEKSYYSTYFDLPKLLVPLTKEKDSNLKDIEFIRILIEFITNNPEISTKSLLNILSNNKILNVNEIIQLYNIFVSAGYDNIAYVSYDKQGYEYEEIEIPMMKVNKPNYFFHGKYVPWIIQTDDIDYENAILINSHSELSQNPNALNLDISESYASEDNINNLINFLEARGITTYTEKLNSLRPDNRLR